MSETYDILKQAIQNRRSIRRFLDRPVEDEKLTEVLQAAQWAPSNHNRQPWRFLVLRDRARIVALAREVRHELSVRIKTLPALAVPYTEDLIHHGTLFGDAPALILAAHKRPVSFAAPLLDGLPNPALISGDPLSTAMAVQNLLLAAHALGLGACVMTAPLMAVRAFATALLLPPGFELTCLIALGHPAETPEPPRRKALEQIVEYL